MVTQFAGRPPPEPPLRIAGRPAHFPHLVAWLVVGIGRNLRGAAAALVATWFLVPVGVAAAAVSAAVLGLVGFLGGATSPDWVPRSVLGLPLVGAAVEAFLPRSGSVVGGLYGVVTGLWRGFVDGMLWQWRPRFEEDPVAAVGSVIGVAAAGVFVGLLYTCYRMAAERRILAVAGARRLSRRESAFLLPIVQECAARLRLPNHPPILMDDQREPAATAYTRHIVINQGLLDEFGYDREVVAGVVCHELVHWRNADPVSAAFIRGVALPLYVVYAAIGWFTRKLHRHPLLVAVLWLVLWPVMVTVRYLVIPAQAAGSRKEEYRADQGAVLAGHRDGLRRTLSRLRRSFEEGRNGWTQSVCAAHPPAELRLERLEAPSGSYPLPDPERPALPVAVPAPVGGSVRQD